jgi:anti-anti-sigma factor
MELAVEDLPGNITRIVLRGRFDTTGAIAIEMPFNALTRERNALVVDLSGVTFLSSYGIRVLLMGAKIAAGRGAKLAVFCPAGSTDKVLRTAGTHEIIPVYSSGDAAVAAVSD